MKDIVIVGGARTPIGSFLGTLKDMPASALGAHAIGAARARAGLEPKDIDDVMMGQVLTAACGQNPARQAALKAGLPKETPAVTVNQVCGSGLRAVAMACQSISAGDAACVIAGGQESMSQAPHAAHIRGGKKMGPLVSLDTMIYDGIWCAMNDYHMGQTAENVARQWQVTRDQQDEFALASQQKAAKAQKDKAFDEEIAPVTVKTRKEEILFARDEYPRGDITLEKLKALRPAFAKDGTVTAGNASGINDGAAALALMSADDAERRGIKKLLGRVVSWATAGVDPAVMGTGPIPASRKALKKAGWSKDDLDLIESNEAFAAQACVVNREMEWDTAKVNRQGGAIALGHPIGASGARLLLTLLYGLRSMGGGKGLATMCIGGGMGIALCVESV